LNQLPRETDLIMIALRIPEYCLLFFSLHKWVYIAVHAIYVKKKYFQSLACKVLAKFEEENSSEI